jgi:hypothetical protein
MVKRYNERRIHSVATTARPAPTSRRPSDRQLAPLAIRLQRSPREREAEPLARSGVKLVSAVGTNHLIVQRGRNDAGAQAVVAQLRALSRSLS